MKYGALREVFILSSARIYLDIFIREMTAGESSAYTYNLYAAHAHLHRTYAHRTHSRALMKHFNPLRKCFSDIFSKH